MLTNPIAAPNDPKDYKSRAKSLKKYSKSVKKAEKAEKKLAKKRSSVASRASTASMASMDMTMSPTTSPAVIEVDAYENALLRERRGSLRRTEDQPSKHNDQNGFSPHGSSPLSDDTTQIWQSGGLKGSLKKVASADLPNRYSVDVGEASAVPIPSWDCRNMLAQEALACLDGKGAGAFIVRHSTNVYGILSMLSPNGSVKDFRIIDKGGKLVLDNSTHTFEDLNSLIRHYSTRSSRQLPCRLVLGSTEDSDDEEPQQAWRSSVSPDSPVRRPNLSPRPRNAPKEEPIANHVLPSTNTNESVEIRRTKATHRPAIVNEQARGAPGQIGQPTTYSTDSREMKRQSIAQSEARTLVNDQIVAGVGVGTIGMTATEIARAQHIKNVVQPAVYNPQNRLDQSGARSRKADASWSGQVLTDGGKHDVPDAPMTLDWERNPTSAAPAILGHRDDNTVFFFEHLYDKEDAESVLNMVGQNGIFLMRPHIKGDNLKFNLSVRLRGRVTHHMLSRAQPGGPFTVCCLPFALTNETLDGRRSCVTLAAVIRHLQQSHEYWPIPLVSGIQSPTSEREMQELLETLQEYNAEKERTKNGRTSQSAGRSHAQRPGALETHIVPFGAPTKQRKSAPVPATTATQPVTRTVKKKVMVKRKRERTKTAAAPRAVSYFHVVKKKVAESMLQADDGFSNPGKFLIRAKDDDEKLDFILSVVYKGKPTHHTVKRNVLDGILVVNDKVNTGANEFAGMVEYLRSKHKGWPIELTEGVPNPNAAEAVNDDDDAGSSEYDEVEEEIEVEELVDAPGDQPEVPNEDVSTNNNNKKKMPPRAELQYTITVVTGGVEGAETTGQVMIQLRGSLGDSDTVRIQGKRRSDKLFERNQEFTFNLSALDIGEPKSVVLHHNGKSASAYHLPDWFVDRVVLERTAVSQDEWHVRRTFMCGTWLNDTDGWKQEFAVDSTAEPTKVELAVPSMEIERNKRNMEEYSDRHHTNPNARGANIGEQTKVDENSRELRRQIQTSANTADVRVDKGIARGSGAVKPAYDTHAAEFSRQMNAPVSSFNEPINPNALMPGKWRPNHGVLGRSHP